MRLQSGRLVEGTQYTFQVSAENEIGVGEAAELAQGISTKSEFSEYTWSKETTSTMHGIPINC